MKKLIWNDAGLDGDIFSKLLEKINEYFDKKMEDAEFEDWKDDLLYCHLKEIVASFSSSFWYEFFKELKRINCDCLYENEKFTTGVARLIVVYLDWEEE